MADPDPNPKDHLTFQRREWKVERVSWWVQLAIVLAALAGLAGNGPLSGGSASSGELRVDYERLARHSSPSAVTVEVGPALVRGGQVVLELDREWLEGVTIERILPEPVESEAVAGGTRFTFRAHGGAPVRVRFDVAYQAAGSRRGRLRVADGPALTFSQWIYP